MCKAVEELAEKWAEESRMDTIANNIRNLMKSTQWTLEKAMDVLEISDEDRSILLKKF